MYRLGIKQYVRFCRATFSTIDEKYDAEVVLFYVIFGLLIQFFSDVFIFDIRDLQSDYNWSKMNFYCLRVGMLKWEMTRVGRQWTKMSGTVPLSSVTQFSRPQLQYPGVQRLIHFNFNG